MRRLAIMKDVGFGLRDTGRPCLWFMAYESECAAALQVLFGEDIEKTLKDSGVYEVHQLEGQACWVEAGGGLIRFAGICKMPKGGKP